MCWKKAPLILGLLAVFVPALVTTNAYGDLTPEHARRAIDVRPLRWHHLTRVPAIARPATVRRLRAVECETYLVGVQSCTRAVRAPPPMPPDWQRAFPNRF
jgi:hypothetical protein